MTDAPDTQYAKTTDGNYVAYQIAGSGEFDMNRPGFPEARWFGFSCHSGLRSETVLGFDLGRRAVVELAV